jgi:hypothetical protein
MPKTSKITFNVNELQRQHTGQRRCYDNVGLARLINSPEIQERVSKGDLIGYYGHWPRKKFGMQPQEGGMDGSKPITLKPAIRTTFLEADNKGNLTHQTEFLDTQEGKDAYDLFQNKVGGFSAAMTTAPKGVTEIPVRFYGFDYVLEPNFSGNRGYTMAFDSVPNDPLILERFDSINDEGDTGELIHVFDSVEDEVLYQNQVMGDLYRRLQGDYRHVLDSAGAMSGEKAHLEQTIQEMLDKQAKQGKRSSRSPIFIDERKIARFDEANSFMTADLVSLDMDDDKDIRAEKAKIAQAKRRYGY